MENEEDVVIEGSDLYNALKQMGSPDFECTHVNRTELPDDWEILEDSKNQVQTFKYPSLFNTYKSIRNYFCSTRTHKNEFHGVKELEIILKLEPLLDDHSSSIQIILKDYAYSKTNGDTTNPLIILSTSLLLASSIISNKLRIPGLITAATLSTLKIYRKYSSSYSLQQLRNLVSTQNKLFHLHKKSLKIIRNGYNLTSDSRRSRKFTDLELKRLEHLQPLFENLCRCIEKCSKMFYRTSGLITDFLPTHLKSSSLLNRFEDETFEIQGEITFKKIEKLYYTYILTQSDMMNLLTIIYSNDLKKISTRLKLSHVINNLNKNLKVYQEKLNSIVEKYQSSKTLEIPRKLERINPSKYQDLYIHVDLLSRKLQTAYRTVSSILEDIDDDSNEESDDFIDSLVFKMTEGYKQIDTARDFAEFNILVMKRIGSRRPQQIVESSNDLVEREEEKVIFDADPEIMDECFEEYIREEYLKPLCEDDDVDLERAKMDKLLERNFMRELRGVLVDKYKSMSEREARALLRYRKSGFDGDVDGVMRIPCPPPLPISEATSGVIEVKNKGPVPLPRTYNRVTMERGEEERIVEPAERFSIKMAIGGTIPAFTRDEETFIGSGENSEEELAGSGCEEDE